MKKRFEYSLCFDYPEKMEAKEFLKWLTAVQIRIEDFVKFLKETVGEDCYIHFGDIIMVNNDKERA